MIYSIIGRLIGRLIAAVMVASWVAVGPLAGGLIARDGGHPLLASIVGVSASVLFAAFTGRVMKP